MKLSGGVTVNSVKHLTVNELAAKAGVSRVTIYRYLSQGKLSFQLDEQGNKIIEASEAYRWLATLGVTPVTSQHASPLLHETNYETSKLQLEVTLLRELLQAKDAIIEEQKMRLLSIPDMRERPAPANLPATPTPVKPARPLTLRERLLNAAGELLK
jgi:transcriptional regulator with XRE-family HTH domain